MPYCKNNLTCFSMEGDLLVKEKKIVYWTHFVYDDWKMLLAATDKGLCYIGSPNDPFHVLENWVQKNIPNYRLVESELKMDMYCKQLKEYFSGTRTNFTMPLMLEHVTPFRQTVWNVLQKIPFGKTVTYTEIAALIQRPKAIRAVGTAIGANPLLIVIPCHRVIGKDGRLRGYRGGLEMKKTLLEIESSYKAVSNRRLVENQ